MKNDLREGYGIMYWPNGDRYEGEFKRGWSQGYGTFFSSLGFKIKGEFNSKAFIRILYFLYRILLLIHFLYSIPRKNKITSSLIIILILGVLIY